MFTTLFSYVLSFTHNNCVKITLNVKNDPKYINMLCEFYKLPRCAPSWTRPGSWIFETSIFIFYEYYPIRIFKILDSKWVLKFYSQPIGRIKTTYYSFKTCLIDAAAKNTWMFQKKCSWCPLPVTPFFECSVLFKLRGVVRVASNKLASYVIGVTSV